MKRKALTPKILYRTTDGCGFVRNRDGTYSLLISREKGMHKHLWLKWPYPRLMDGSGLFSETKPVIRPSSRRPDGHGGMKED